MEKHFKGTLQGVVFCVTQLVIWIVVGILAWLLNDMTFKQTMASPGHTFTFIVGIIPSVFVAAEFGEWYESEQ